MNKDFFISKNPKFYSGNRNGARILRRKPSLGGHEVVLVSQPCGNECPKGIERFWNTFPANRSFSS